MKIELKFPFEQKQSKKDTLGVFFVLLQGNLLKLNVCMKEEFCSK